MLTRSYYSCDIIEFLQEDSNPILGKLTKNHPFALEEQQRNAWLKEIEILKKELKNLTPAHIFFEYSIPRIGKRADVILILEGLVFVLEFKINEKEYKSSDIDQCLDYALDLKYFHEKSQNLHIIPILVAVNGLVFSP